MNETGRKTDILILDEKYTDPRTGVEVINTLCFTVWADEDMKEVIKSVEGVVNVYNIPVPTQFSVYYDQRYDREAVKAEIVAAIRNAKG